MFCKFAPPETISVRDFNFVSETDWRGEECDQSCISGPVTAISLLLVVISYLLRLISLMPTASLTRINKFLPTRWVIYFIKTITRRSYQVPVNTVQSRHNRQVWSASLLNSYNPIFLQLRTMPRLAGWLAVVCEECGDVV